MAMTAPDRQKHKPKCSKAQRRKVRNYYRRLNFKRLHRWWTERCSACGHRMWFAESAYSVPGSGIFHDYCHREFTQRHRANDLFAVLDVVTDVWQVDLSTVQMLMGNRAASDGYERSNAENRAWRVFYALKNHRTKQAREASL